ncbi:alpha/beta hydrolase [Desulfoferrobacter suflitae]|uniref:alpha/beta hydrolase n=1 Tax=Desulfoferrobacter suflitae TaxID=2865782 RepID=UPI002164E6B2|nr:hypothetical protein [Desulfoferrobacter suflitae]MCK8603467.1 hypothetical protein [Desulfoferrobacter suflitae]
MSEGNLMIDTGQHMLEGLFDRGENPSTAAIVCHPHPLYGGDMDNGVVVAMQKTLRSCGWSTLRFNFRGVGGSSGSYGEGEGEAEDTKGVAAYLSQQGFDTICLGGYSFGAWVALKAVGPQLSPACTILVSPPVDFLSFANLALPSTPCLITLGDRDDFCRLASLRQWIAQQTVDEALIEVELLPRCDHFYGVNEALLSAKIGMFLARHFKNE